MLGNKTNINYQLTSIQYVLEPIPASGRITSFNEGMRNLTPSFHCKIHKKMQDHESLKHLPEDLKFNVTICLFMVLFFVWFGVMLFLEQNRNMHRSFNTINYYENAWHKIHNSLSQVRGLQWNWWQLEHKAWTQAQIIVSLATVNTMPCFWWYVLYFVFGFWRVGCGLCKFQFMLSFEIMNLACLSILSVFISSCPLILSGFKPWSWEHHVVGCIGGSKRKQNKTSTYYIYIL